LRPPRIIMYSILERAYVELVTLEEYYSIIYSHTQQNMIVIVWRVSIMICQEPGLYTLWDTYILFVIRNTLF